MEKNVAGAEPRSRLGLGIERELALCALELAGVLLAFYITYAGVRLLEGQRHITRGVVYFVVATIVLVVVTRRVRQRDEAASLTLPALNRATLRQPGRLARELAASWQAIAWWGLLLAAIGLGFAFRLYEIASAPFGIWFDEAQNGIVAQQILDGDRPIFIGGITQLPALFFYVFALAIKLLGDNVTSLRAVTTAAGILTVLFTYLLARELFDQRVAVLSTFFLAVMRWHVNFSRFAMHGIFAPLFMVATFYFLVRGLKGKGQGNFAVAGVMAGIGLQGYYSFLLVPFLIGFYLLHHVIFERVLPWRKLALGLGAFAIATAIVYAPLGIWALQHPDEFNQRAQTVTITQDRSASEVMHVAYKSTKQHLLMFSSAGDRNGRHNIPGRPMLDIYTGSLLVLGAGYALSRANKSSYFLLLAWVVITLQGGIWSVDFEAPQAFRTVGITPALAMLAALPLALLWRVAASPASGDARSPGKSRLPSVSQAGYYALGGVAALVTIFALVQAGRINFDQYFNVQLKDPTSWVESNADVTAVAKGMKSLGPGYNYLLSSSFAGWPTLEFVYPQVTSLARYEQELTSDLPLDESRSTVIFLDRSRETDFQWLRVLYPDASFEEVRQPPGSTGPAAVFKAIIPVESIDRLRGIEATYRSEDGKVIQRREAAIDFDWNALQPTSIPFQAQWSGLLKETEDGSHTFVVEAPGHVLLRLDNRTIGEGDARVEAAVFLFAGSHRLEVDASIDAPGAVSLSDNGGLVRDSAFFSTLTDGHGILASFFDSQDWSGQPAVEWVDPSVGFLYQSDIPGGPFSAIWSGWLEAPTDGSYSIGFEAVGEAAVAIDGREVIPLSDHGQQVVDLTSGRHRLEVRFRSDQGSPQVFFYWARPGQPREFIPTRYLSPR